MAAVDLDTFLGAIFPEVNTTELVCLVDARPDPTGRIIFPPREWKPGRNWKWPWPREEIWPSAAYAEARLYNYSKPHPEGLGYNGVVCRLWQLNKSPKGYGHIKVEGYNCGAHRISYMAAYGFLPRKILVCHHCDRRACIEPTHLFAGTQKMNLDDMRRKNRQRYAQAEKAPNAKLTEEAVNYIRSSTEFQHVLAKRFGVSQPTIARAQKAKTWRSVRSG